MSKIVIVPAGIAGFTWLNKPDTKFAPAGEYKTETSNSIDIYRPFMTAVRDARDAFVKDQEAKGVKIKKMAEFPWSVDDVTKDIKIKSKLKANVTLKDGTSFSQRPTLFDANKNRIDPASVNIYSGSKLSMAVELVPFYTATAGAGVTLRLKAVQVIALAQSRSKSGDFDFAIFEDGFDSASHVKASSADYLINDDDNRDPEDFFDVPADSKSSVNNTNHDF